MWPVWHDSWLQQQFSGSRQLALLLDIGQWLARGHNLKTICRLLGQSARELGLRPEARILALLEHQARAGRPLAEGMNGWFRADLIVLVRVGERAGCLTLLLQQFASFLVQREALVRRALHSLWYPCTLVLVSLLATWLLGQQVLPRFSDVSEQAAWPQSSQLLLKLSAWLEHYGPLLLTLGVGVALSILVLVRQAPGWALAWLDQTSWLSVYRWYCGVVLLQQTGLLLQAGLSLRQSLELQQRAATPYLRQHVARALAALARGQCELSRVFHTGLFSPALLFRLQLQGQSTGESGSVLLEFGRELQQLAERRLEQQRKLLIVSCFGTTTLLVVLMVAGLGQLLAQLAATWV